MTATATAAPRRSRKLLVPLVTLLAATGVAFASGASFTTATASTGLVASGTLNQINSNSIAFEKTNLKPGDVVTGTVTITNSGSLPARLSITEQTPGTGDITFAPTSLKLEVTEGSTVVSASKQLGTAGKFASGLEMAAGQSRTFTYTVTFDVNAPNTEQAKVARTTYRFDTIQSTPETFNGTQSGVPQDTKPTDQPAPLTARTGDAPAPTTVTPLPATTTP